VDVTYRNTSGDGLWVGFTYEALDPHGTVLAVLNTPVQQIGPRETKTLASGGTTAGPSGIPCARVARVDDAGDERPDEGG
jgi:hypothetical protein